MILTCPECETQYFAEDSTIGDSGRTVKCASCGHSWFVKPPEAETPSARRAGAHETYRARLRERRLKKSRFAAASAWMVSAALAFVILAGLVIFRNDVVRTWPQAASAYRLVGMDVNRFRIDFVSTSAERFFDGTTPILEIRGTVINLSPSDVAAPRVRVVLLDDEGQELTERFTQITPAVIAANETAEFVLRVENPPYEAFDLDLFFAPVDTAAVETEPEQP